MIRLFRVFVPASVLTLLGSEIILTTSCFILASFLILDIDPTVFLLYDGGLARVGFAVSSIVAGLYFHDLYTHVRVRSKILLLQQLCQVTGIAFLAQALVSYLDPNWMLPRWLMIMGSGLGLITLPAWRIFYSGVVLRAFGGQRVLLLGSNSVVREIAQHLAEHPEMGQTVIGYVDDDRGEAAFFDRNRLLGPMEDLRQIVSETRPDRIIVGMSERRARLPVHDLLELRFSGIRIEEAASAYEDTCGRISTKELRPAQLIFSRELGPRPANVILQSLYSMIIALIGTLLLAPVMVLVALAVKLSSPGPILHRQARVGMNGVPFVLYKFRSMCVDAEASSGAVWATRGDPRITSVGRWLRRFRLDELAQFLNVLRGDMSIVGPRPERPEFVETLTEQIPYYRQRHCVKPGITGWAQINHKYGDTLEDTITKLEYDLYYIKNIAPALDAYIIFHTLKTMLLSRGAQ